MGSYKTNIFLPDTCDLNWQSTRNELIIAAFVISLASFCGVLIALVIVLTRKSKSSNKQKFKLEEVSHDGHLLHVYL